MEVFTVVRYQEKIEGTTVKDITYKNKSFTAEKIFDVSKKNNFQVIVITRDILLVKAMSSFYENGHEKYRYWTFFTTEEYNEILKEAEA